jgi:alkyldihydroxyacetonephosphate synthase
VRLRSGSLARFPDGVARPANRQEVQRLFRLAAEWQATVIPCGGGTSVAGQLEIPASERPVLSFSLADCRCTLGIDRENRLAEFEAGIRGPELEKALNAQGYTLGHFPQSFEYSTLGGWVATRSCGQESGHYGRIEDLFAGGEVLTPDGPLRLPPLPASAAGPDLRHWVLGSEGCMGIISTVFVRIARLPERSPVSSFFFPDWDSGVQAVRELACSGEGFSMVRLSNPAETTTQLALAGRERETAWLRRYLGWRGVPPESACLCLVGLIGSRRRIRHQRACLGSIFREFKALATGRPIGTAWKKNRFRAAYLRNTLWRHGYAVDTLETAVSWNRVTKTMQKVESALCRALAERSERVLALTHLSHVYPTGSSVYTTFVFRRAASPEETLDRWQKMKQAASLAVIEAGGTISHQHGVGLDHRDYLAAEKSAAGIRLLRAGFRQLDPERRMNPGKLIP